ncbi:MAG: hypothetical protein ACRC8A_06155 [Microcoleaceae cyanobacterium]
MTDPSPGPYKSRAFNFLAQGYRRFLDSCDRTWRQIKGATDTATHYLLYPFALMAQALRQVGRQLRSGQGSNRPELEARQRTEVAHPVVPVSAVPTDLSIQGILLIAREEVGRSSGKIVSAKVRGIATLLKSRELILVGVDNQVMKLLSSGQQQLLRGYIHEELGGKPSALALLPPSVSGTLQTTFQAVLRASQRYRIAPIKVTTAVFQTAQDLQQSIQQAWQITAEKKLLPGSDQRLHSAFGTNFNRMKSLMLSTADRFFNHHIYQLDAQLNSRTSSEHQLKQYLNQHPEQHSEQLSGIAQPPVHSRTMAPINPVALNFKPIVNPFSSAEIPAETVAKSVQQKINAIGSQSIDSLAQPRSRFRRGRAQETQPVKITETQASYFFDHKTQGSTLTRVEEASAEVSAWMSEPAEMFIPESDAEGIPEWLEVQVTTQGYEKHILEHTLERLDRLMVWVEETVLKLWQWLTNRLARN